MNPKRILRNEEDASPGGGAIPPAPAEPQAQADAPITMSALRGVLDEFKTSLKSEVVTEAKNGVNADLRRAGVFKKNSEPSEATTAPTNPPAGSASASTGLSMTDVEAMLEMQDVVSTRRAEYKLSDALTRRMKASLSGVSRESLASEADAFLNDLGLAKATTSTATKQAAPAPAAPVAAIPNPANNITDRGPATAGDVRDVETLVQTRPLEMSSSDFERLTLKVGREKALQTVQTSVNSHMRSIRLTPDRRR